MTLEGFEGDFAPQLEEKKIYQSKLSWKREKLKTKTLSKNVNILQEREKKDGRGNLDLSWKILILLELVEEDDDALMEDYLKEDKKTASLTLGMKEDNLYRLNFERKI